jgi:hypothetical protein
VLGVLTGLVFTLPYVVALAVGVAFHDINVHPLLVLLLAGPARFVVRRFAGDGRVEPV